MRLHKYLASLGVGSRRTIESWIQAGKIEINGKKAIIGQSVSEKDKIRVDGKWIAQPSEENPVRVLMYHKPEGEICSRSTEDCQKTVFDYLPKLDNERWVMVGRLDVNTAGLLLFTNKGEVAHQLMHPKFQLIRKYAVRVLGKITEENLSNLKKGVFLSTGMARFKEIIPHEATMSANQWFTVSLTEGKYREVRELFASQGATVSRIIRTQYGPVSLPRDLKKGQWRELSAGAVKSFTA